jgi:hypothetical protein
MCPFGIVAVTSVSRSRPDLFQGRDDPSIKRLVAEGAVETLNIGILVRLAWFDEGKRDTPRRASCPQGFGDEFRPSVAPQLPRRAMAGHQVVKAFDQPGTGQRVVRLDRERFPTALVEDVRQVIAAPTIHRVAHEGHHSGMVQRCRVILWHDLAFGYPPFGPTHLIELARAIHAGDPFVIPRVAQRPDLGKALPEAPAPMLRHDGL